VVGDLGQYLVMDFIDGEDLRQRMERLGTINEDDAVVIGAAICDALDYLHTRKPSIIHRDIKPGNVKITPDGHIYLVDLVLPKLFKAHRLQPQGAGHDARLFSAGTIWNRAYRSAHGCLFSRCNLYAALCGVIPEDGLARAMDNAQLTPLRKRNPKASRASGSCD